MQIRKGEIEDFKKLNHGWAWGNTPSERKAQNDYIEGIKRGAQEFLVIANGDDIIGELHIYWDQNDKDEANGKDRAYLSALRIHPDFRNQGLGTQLIQSAINRIKEKDYKEVTIAAYIHEPDIGNLYKKWGFVKRIKEGVEETTKGKPAYILLMKKL